MSNLILTTLEERILRIQINRPEKKNALTVAMYGALTDALRSGESDPTVRAVVISGAGGVFSAGNDIADFMQWPPVTDDSPVFQFLRTLVGAQKPLLAAVEGVAVGIGVTMLLHCDLIYAGRSARFQLPFVNLGLVPEAGSSLLLPVALGQRRAAALLMLGDPFDATTAQEAGIVNRVVGDGESLPVALETARQLAARPPAALRQTKWLMKRHTAALLDEAIRIEAQAFRERLSSPEANEAFTAFMERRKPDFSRFD
jgi:enoyl-CoA hydratase/carnithine racemase